MTVVNPMNRDMVSNPEASASFFFREPARRRLGKRIEHERLGDGTSNHASEEPAVTLREDAQKPAQTDHHDANARTPLQSDGIDAHCCGDADACVRSILLPLLKNHEKGGQVEFSVE